MGSPQNVHGGQNAHQAQNDAQGHWFPESGDAHQGGHHGFHGGQDGGLSAVAQVAEPLGVEQVGNHRPHHHKSQGEDKDICDLQVIAFPQEGIYANEGTEKLMWEAMEMGCDIAGGMPAAEWLPELARKHVDLVFEIAEKYNVPIDMHIDQSKDMFDRSLEYTAWLTLQKGWGPRVTGGHCTSITYQNQSHAIKVMKLIKEAGMNICTNTQVLAIMGIDAEPRTRGVTRIREMVEMGINVATAQDTICDGFHLYGTGDPLDYGLVGAYTAQYNTPGTAKTIFDMLTTNSMRIFDPDAKYGIEVGNDADLNILDADNIQEALRTRASRPYILRHGKVIASFERKAALL